MRSEPAFEEGAIHQIELRPNCSLSVRGALLFFSSLCLVSFSIAAVFAWLGFWPIFPFAGLEMVALGVCLHLSLRARHQRETIAVSNREIVIDSYSSRARRHVVFPRHWARVTLRAPHSALHPSRLLIESHGRACEVGRFLLEAERRGLAKRLKALIGNVNESPQLGDDSHLPPGVPAH